MRVEQITSFNKGVIDDIVAIHIATFKGFFLSFLGRGFLYQMYTSYCQHDQSGLLVAFDENNQTIGFLAYSENLSGLYKFMIKKKVFYFAWYSLGAFFRKPTVFMRLIRAFLKPSESKREEEYVELTSIGVEPTCESKGVGTKLISSLKEMVDFSKHEYICLETDAENNEGVNHFYQKNGFVLERTYETHEGRRMNEYRFGGN